MRILIFADSSAIMVEEDNPDSVTINGQAPVEELEATPENIAQYFPNLPNEEDSDIVVSSK